MPLELTCNKILKSVKVIILLLYLKNMLRLYPSSLRASPNSIKRLSKYNTNISSW